MNVVPREKRITSKALPKYKNKNEFIRKDSSLGKILIHIELEFLIRKL